ncbi:MAG: alanine--tRNA ligase [Acidobacteria bacterium]|nr:MAG: alanine--tRNA ligase [Acidobacteriota bacterium]
MNVMKVKDIRKCFLDYFAQKGHRVVASSSLVPVSDPTLLFINAGMNQFKDVFLGLETRDYNRATTVQKCVRAGGKHNDLENVGVTARHHTFFEMLGNFSFGDYFKKDAIDFAWEFLVDELKLDPERLAVTIFEGDDDVPRDDAAYDFWRKYFEPERIHELGRKDNFWSMGDTGPCGPCSEIHFFQGDQWPCNETECLGVACECDRWLEIWNLVFMQFNRTEDKKLHPLPKPSVDTGMGLERIAVVVQNVLSNYDTDLFTGLLDAIGKRTGKTYERSASADDVSFRVIADHVRASAFLISDGVMPANEGRGYVLRKIMRRGMRHGKKLGVEEPFLYELTENVIAEMQSAYPELLLSRELVRRVVQSEEERFATTLATGIAALEEKLGKEDVAKSKELPGADAFKLYDTFGVPLDLLVDIAAESGVTVDSEGFDREMERQRSQARESWKKAAAVPDRSIYGELRGRFETRFDGYEQVKISESRVLALMKDGVEVPELREGEEGEVFLDQTPFYPEGGGQLGDRGVLAGPDGVADVVNTQSPVSELVSHHVRMSKGTLGQDQRVVASVDATSRKGAASHHTITHMLHAALRETLGPHVKQAGSLVAPNRLRFDFSHFAPMTLGELQQIEGRVNEKVQEDLDVATDTLSLDDALARGAMAFFGEKYGDRVRIVEIPDFSLELCGGTHLRRTGEAGPFIITSESSVASGIRRVEALTGLAAMEQWQKQRALIDEASHALKTPPEELSQTASRLREALKRKEREVQELKLKLATGGSSGADAATTTIGDVLVWTPAPLDGYGKKQHRQVVDMFKEKHQSEPWVAISTAVNDDKVSVIVEVSKGLVDQIRADQLIKELAAIIEGRGGGKAERAEAGGGFPDRIPGLLERGLDLVRLALSGQRV